MNRKDRRKQAAEMRKQNKHNEPVLEKISLFNKLEDQCLTCEKPFDKTDKEMVQSWYVIVKEEEKVVRMYCPPCFERARKIVEEFKQHLEEKYNGS